MRKHVMSSIVLGLILIICLSAAFYSYDNYTNEEVLTVNKSINKPAQIPSEDIGSIQMDDKASIPDSYNVERPLTGDLKVANKKSVGELDFSDTEVMSFDIVGPLSKDKADILEKVKKQSAKVYTSTIDWTNNDISIKEYKALLAATGQMYEDQLNENAVGKYTVQSDVPDSEVLAGIGVNVLFDVNEDGMLTIWNDIIVRDSTTSTEVQELKQFVIYYVGNVLTLK